MPFIYKKPPGKTGELCNTSLSYKSKLVFVFKCEDKGFQQLLCILYILKVDNLEGCVSIAGGNRYAAGGNTLMSHVEFACVGADAGEDFQLIGNIIFLGYFL